MSKIFTITPVMWTSQDANAGTDSSVYMGIGGREFHLDTSRDDFEPGNGLNTSVGAFNQVNDPEMNDPRTPLPLMTETLDRFPVYFRLDGDDHWKMWNALIWVSSGASESTATVTDVFTAPIISTIENDRLKGGLWLGPKSGRWVFLSRRKRGDLGTILQSPRLVQEAEAKLARWKVKLAEWDAR